MRPAGLHARASQWHAAAGNIEDAVEHAFAVPDIERVLHLLEQYGTIMIFDGRLATYLNWIQFIPHEEIFKRAHLCADCSWTFALSGRLDLAERFVLAGKKSISTAQPIHIASRRQVISVDEVLGDLTSVQAYCARLRGDSRGVRRYSQEALRQLPPDTYTVRGVIALNLGLDYYQSREWEAATQAFTESVKMILKSHENIYVAIVALGMLGGIQTQQGDLDMAGNYFKQAIALGEKNVSSDSSAIPSACLGYRGLVEIHYLRNQVEEAVKPLETALELARQSGNTDMLYNIYQLGAWLALLVGDISGAEAAIQKAEEYFPKNLSVKSHPELIVLRATSLLMQENSWTAIAVLNEADVSVARLPLTDKPQTVHVHVLLARTLMLENRITEAMQLLETLQSGSNAGWDMGLLIETRLLMAVLADKQNDGPRAREIFNEALQLAEPAGYVSPFLNIGKPLHEFIRSEILSGGLKSDHAQKILAAFAGQTRKVRAALFTESERLSGAESLTRQETQILRLLAQGLSSTEVAAELVIAVSTARSYIKSIHRKLNAHSREVVLARGKQLGLI